MSFGWSAGDIATAVTVVYNLIQALDSCDGAAGDYRETVSFLQDLKRTLEPLQTFTAWNAYPAYGQDIGKHVGHIKEPVEQFLAAIRKYEPSLGARAQDGHHRHIVRKLQWHMFVSKKVLSLKKKIESRMRIIDTLMQRLTLDMVWTTQQKLPDTLRATFQQTLRPELIAVLKEQLPPLNLALLDNYQQSRRISGDAQDSRLLELYEGLYSSVEDIKQQISSPKIMKQRIEFSLRGDSPKTTQKVLVSAERSELDLNGNDEYSDQSSSSTVRRASVTILQEPLQEIYYLVFLYLGHFLKNLFLVLSNLVQPSRALMPNLLAKYNISFLDAIGRPPRILPYEYFRSFKVLRTFIKYEFKNLPGTAWVDQGRYLMFNLTNDQILNEHNWGSTVVPGTAVAMSMLLQERFVSSLNLKEQRCPKSTCSGTWTRPETQSWVTCPVCQKEILNFVSSKSEALVRNAWNDPDSSNGSDFEPYSAINPSVAQRGVDTHSRKRIVEKTPHLDDDIAVFKRVVQQFVAESKTNLSILRRGKDVIAWGPKEREEIRKKEKKKVHSDREQARGKERKRAAVEEHRSRESLVTEETSDSWNDDVIYELSPSKNGKKRSSSRKPEDMDSLPGSDRSQRYKVNTVTEFRYITRLDGKAPVSLEDMDALYRSDRSQGNKGTMGNAFRYVTRLDNEDSALPENIGPPFISNRTGRYPSNTMTEIRHITRSSGKVPVTFICEPPFSKGSAKQYNKRRIPIPPPPPTSEAEDEE